MGRVGTPLLQLTACRPRSVETPKRVLGESPPGPGRSAKPCRHLHNLPMAGVAFFPVEKLTETRNVYISCHKTRLVCYPLENVQIWPPKACFSEDFGLISHTCLSLQHRTSRAGPQQTFSVKVKHTELSASQVFTQGFNHSCAVWSLW